MGWGGGLGLSRPRYLTFPAKFRCWRGRCLTDFGATGAGRGVWGSHRARTTEQTKHNAALCGVSGTQKWPLGGTRWEGTRGELARIFVRTRPCCAWDWLSKASAQPRKEYLD